MDKTMKKNLMDTISNTTGTFGFEDTAVLSGQNFTQVSQWVSEFPRNWRFVGAIQPGCSDDWCVIIVGLVRQDQTCISDGSEWYIPRDQNGISPSSLF